MIDLTEGFDPHPLSQEIWGALSKNNHPRRLFLWSGKLVRMQSVVSSPNKPARMHIVPLTLQMLQHEVARIVRFFRATKKAVKALAPPRDLVGQMLNTPPSEIPLPAISRIAAAPVVTTAGAIITAGYDGATGIFVITDLPLFEVPRQPTTREVKSALQILLEPLQDFPFVDESDRATALAAMFGPFVRDFIVGPTPLHLFTKPEAGTGAGLLTDVVCSPAVGYPVPRISAQSDDAEWNRTLTAEFRQTPSMVVLDNVRSLTTPQLAKAITDGEWQGRIVGSSDLASIPVFCIWLATGNNVELHRELERRVVYSRLDAGKERPEEGREFAIPGLALWLVDHRPGMVRAILTIVRGWYAAGQPRSTKRLGSFEEWSAVIGGILEFAGVPGFLDQKRVIDVETEAYRWFIGAWFDQHKSAVVRVSDLVPLLNESDNPLLQLMASRDLLNQQTKATRLGYMVRSLTGRVFGVGYTSVRVTRENDHSGSKTAQYRLVPLRTPRDSKTCSIPAVAQKSPTGPSEPSR